MVSLAPCLAALALAQAEPAAGAEKEAAAAEKPAAASSSPTATPTPTATPSPSGPVRPERSGAEGAAESKAATTPRPRPATAPPSVASPLAREQVARAARSFLDALAAGDANALAEASSERFSFDGDVESGRDAVRRTWRTVLAGRGGPPPAVNGVEVLPAADAVARLGKPPARIASLARDGVWVAIGDVGGRPVVLFIGRENSRPAVLGLHD